MKALFSLVESTFTPMEFANKSSQLSWSVTRKSTGAASRVCPKAGILRSRQFSQLTAAIGCPVKN